jgi:hypothetical protein
MRISDTLISWLVLDKESGDLNLPAMHATPGTVLHTHFIICKIKRADPDWLKVS